ncbi:hypothetical protein L0F63_006243, partial [Massospora cicadina]
FDWFLENSPLATEGLDILSLFVFLLKGDPSPLVKRHIIFYALPRLAQAAGAHLPSRVLRLLQSLGSEPSLEAVAVRALCALYAVYPRAWAPLRHELATRIRQFKAKAPLGKPPLELGPAEVVAFLTMREACAKMPQASQDLFPLLASLLQYASLPPPALASVMACVNSAVEHQVVESGAAWNALFASLSAKVHKLGGNLEVLVELFKFYRLLVAQSTGSEGLMPVLDDILKARVMPAIFSDGQVSSHALVGEALKVLCAFPTSVVVGSLPVSPPELVTSLLSIRTGDCAWAPLLALLMDQELEQTSRATFKGSVSRAPSTSPDKRAQFRSQVQGPIRAALARPCHPGVHASAAFAKLAGGVANVGPDRSTQSWRTFHAGLTDFSPGFDLSLHCLHFTGWVSFFTAAAAENANAGFPLESNGLVDVDMLDKMFKELKSTLHSSQPPTVLSNASVALCALPLGLLSLGKDPLARIYAVQAVNLLLETSAKSASPAILAATAAGLSGLAPTIPGERSCLHDIIQFLERALQAPHKLGGEWLQLASLRGLAHLYDVVLGGLIADFSSDGSQLLASVERVLVSQQLKVGLGDGTFAEDESLPALLSRALAHAQISAAWFCHSKLHFQLSMPPLPADLLPPGPLLKALVAKLTDLLGRLEEHPGLVNPMLAVALTLPALSPLIPHLSEDRHAEAELDSAVCRALTQAQLVTDEAAVHYLHLALGTHLHIRANQHPPVSTLGAYNKLFNQYLDGLEGNPTHRPATLVGLSALFGGDPLNYMPSPPYFLDPASSPKCHGRALDIFRAAATGHDLVSARWGLVVLGRVTHLGLSPFLCNHSSLFRLVATHSPHLLAQPTSLSDEPADYTRFPASSCLRAVFDGIKLASKTRDRLPTGLVLIRALAGLAHPLPPVNWLALMHQLFAQLSTREEVMVVVQFCLGRMRFSPSLVEFVLYLCCNRTLPVACPEAFERLVGEPGIGSLASLVGLVSTPSAPSQGPAGSWGTLLKPVALALPRFQEILASLLAYFSAELSRDGLSSLETFFSTLNRHLRCPPEDSPMYGEISRLVDELRGVARTLLTNDALVEAIGGEAGHEIILELSRLACVKPSGLASLHAELPLAAFFSCLQACYEQHRDADSVQTFVEAFLLGLQSYLASPSQLAKVWLVRFVLNYSASPKDRLAWVVRVLDQLILTSGGCRDPLDVRVAAGLDVLVAILSPTATPPTPPELPLHLSRAGWALVRCLEEHELAGSTNPTPPPVAATPLRAQLARRVAILDAHLQAHAAASLAYKTLRLWFLYLDTGHPNHQLKNH